MEVFLKRCYMIHFSSRPSVRNVSGKNPLPYLLVAHYHSLPSLPFHHHVLADQSGAIFVEIRISVDEGK